MFHAVILTILLVQGIAFGYDVYHNYMTKDRYYRHDKAPVFDGKFDRNR